MALSTIEAEYIKTSIANREASWLCNFLLGLLSRHNAEGIYEAPIHIHR
jgi:hypothetical protein